MDDRSNTSCATGVRCSVSGGRWSGGPVVRWSGGPVRRPVRENRAVVRIRASRRVNQVNVQRQRQSRLPVPMPSQWSTRTCVSSCETWEIRTRSDLRGVTEDTRSDLRRRQQRRVIEDANEDCQSAPDAIH